MSDIEQILRRELEDVAGHVRTRRVPATELAAAGRSVQRRRRAIGATLSAAVVVAVLAVATSVTGVLTTAPTPPALPTPAVTRASAPDPSPSPSPSQEEGVPQAEVEAAQVWFGQWLAGLPAAKATAVPQAEEKDGYAVWEGRHVALPRGPGLPDGRVSQAHLRTTRGLMVSWLFDTGTDPGFDTVGGDYRQQLGWITPDRRWARLETGLVQAVVVSPDGGGYAYVVDTGGGPGVVTVRDSSTDAVRGRYRLPEGGSLAGWNRSGLVLGMPSDEGAPSTFTWSPGARTPALLAEGWSPQVVSRNLRILAAVEGSTCGVAVLETAGAEVFGSRGCGPGELSPDGRYLVEGLTVTDLDVTGGVTSLAPVDDEALGPLPSQQAMEAVMGPDRRGRWLDDRTLETDVEAVDGGRTTVRCTVPSGPCRRVVD